MSSAGGRRIEDLLITASVSAAMRSRMSEPMKSSPNRRRRSFPYKLKARPMRSKPGLDLDRARDLAGRLEDEEHLHETSAGK
jgi:hypothetical protein